MSIDGSDLVVYGAADLRRILGVGRPNAYVILRQLGRRVGRRLVVARAVLEAWLAEREARPVSVLARRKARVRGRRRSGR